MRRGFTLLELLIVLVIGAALLGLSVPHWARYRNRLAARRAAAEVASFYHTARYGAILRGHRVRMEFSASGLRAIYEGAADSVFLVRPGPARFGVDLTASRSTIRIGPTGLGYGTANTTLVFRRGAAAESLTTSRLGRLKRW